MFPVILLLLVALQAPAALPPPDPGPTYRIDPTTVTLIGGMIVTIITTIGGVVVSIITAMRVNAVSAQGQATANQLVTVAKDTEAIKGHVNSEKTAATGREASLQNEIRMLREMLADKTIAASLLAQAAAGRTASRATDPHGGAAGAVPLPVEVVNAPLMVEQKAPANPEVIP